jgi:hypothetical protein
MLGKYLIPQRHLNNISREWQKAHFPFLSSRGGIPQHASTCLNMGDMSGHEFLLVYSDIRDPL